MMKNYERYKNVTAEQYDKKTALYYLCRQPSDKKILPIIDGIKNANVLDVGIGTGYYATMFMKDNRVTGLDINPHLCRLPVKVYEGDATGLSNLIKDRFDIVFSAWMTEYLNGEQLNQFFSEAKKTLNENGRLLTTVISSNGVGWLYVTAAGLVRNIQKYSYRPADVRERLIAAGFHDIKIMKLRARLGMPWAYLVDAK